MGRIRVDAGAASAVLLLAVAFVVMVPIGAAAQSVAGVVRDTSGAVLPGVSIEAASPALIEKVRTAVSDGAGQYRLENLTPGVYKITYTLPGFNTFERDGVEITTGVTVTINADMRLGGVQETITVSGETPVVDVQNTATRNLAIGNTTYDLSDTSSCQNTWTLNRFATNDAACIE